MGHSLYETVKTRADAGKLLAEQQKDKQKKEDVACQAQERKEEGGWWSHHRERPYKAVELQKIAQSEQFVKGCLGRCKSELDFLTPTAAEAKQLEIRILNARERTPTPLETYTRMVNKEKNYPWYEDMHKEINEEASSVLAPEAPLAHGARVQGSLIGQRTHVQQNHQVARHRCHWVRGDTGLGTAQDHCHSSLALHQGGPCGRG